MGNRDRIVSVVGRKQEGPEKNKCWRAKTKGKRDRIVRVMGR